MANLSFSKVTTVASTGLIAGRIYFETSTGCIKVAKSETEVDVFGAGVKSASWDEVNEKLTIVNQNNKQIEVDFSDIASASSVTSTLATKLNIGSSGDASSVESYHGLKKYVDEQIGEIPAAIVYKGDGTTITQSGSSEVTFAVGTIGQDKVSGLSDALAGKAATVHTHTKSQITDFDESDYATAAQGTKADTALQTISAAGDGNLTLTATSKSGTTQAISGSLNISTVSSNGAGLTTASDVKSYVDSVVNTSLSSVLKYKGSCAYAELPEEPVTGDVWNVTDAHDNVPAGTNYAWNGESWDALAGSVDLSPYLTSAIASSTYATKTELTSGLAGKAAVDHTHEIADVTGLQSALDAKVPNTRTVNGKALSTNITLTAGDVGAAATSHTHTIAQVTDLQDTLDTKVETLADLAVTATATELNYVAGVTSNIQTQLNAKVPNTRTVNGKALSANITIGGTDVIVGGSGDHATDSVATAIAELEDAIATAQASGVTSFGGQTGAITVNTTAATNGQVKFAMSSKQLTGTVVGLGSAAYTASTAYDAAGTATTKADAALTSAKAYTDSKWVWAEFE